MKATERQHHTLLHKAVTVQGADDPAQRVLLTIDSM